jgi:uncharacterized protein with PQ loop repeat
MNFGTMCAPLQVYVLICLLSFILQLHATYSSKPWSWVNRNKLTLFLSFVFNLVVFVFWGKVIQSLCLTKDKDLAWILIFAPIVLALFTSALMLSGLVVEKVGDTLR